MLAGSWKSFEELENSVTVEELFNLQSAVFRREHRVNRFAAAIQGIDIDESNQEESSFDRVKMRADAELSGKTEDEFVFNMIGIEIDTDEE